MPLFGHEPTCGCPGCHNFHNTPLDNGPLPVVGQVKSDGMETHFTYVNPVIARDEPGWHVSTSIRGIGKVDQINISDLFKD